MLPGVGFFGCGTLANVLIADLQEQGFQIMAIWSPNADEAIRISHERNIPFHSTVIDKVLLLPSVQLIVTACPPHYHNQIASKACGIGKHVVCDWPPSHCLQDTVSMRRAASNYPKLITLFLTGLRFVPTFQIVRKLLMMDADDDNNQTLIGPIRVINATVMCDVVSVYEERSVIWDKEMGGGLLSLYGTNMIDIISFVTGCRAQRVHGMVNCIKQLSQNPILFNTTEDYVNFQMEMFPTMKSNRKQVNKSMEPMLAHVTLNGHHYNHFPKHEIYFYGSKGYLLCRDGDIFVYVHEMDEHSSLQMSNIGYAVKKPLLNKETLIYSLSDLDIWKPGSSLPTSSAYNSYVYPRIYLIGIRNMIMALKSAFYGEQDKTTYLFNKHSKTNDSPYAICTTPANNPNNPNNLTNLTNPTNTANINKSSTLTSGYHQYLQMNGLNQSSTTSSHQHASQSVNGKISSSSMTNGQLKSTIKPSSSEDQDPLSMVHWIKDPVNQAVNFDDGIYLQQVIESIRLSSERNEWIRIHRFD